MDGQISRRIMEWRGKEKEEEERNMTGEGDKDKEGTDKGTG